MEKVQLLWVSRAFTHQTGGVKPHSHPYYHLFCILAGSLRMLVAGKVYQMDAGSCILMPKGTEHSYSNAGDTLSSHLDIKFSIPSATLDAQITRLGALVSDSPLTVMLGEQIVADYANRGAQADESAASYLLALLHTMIPTERPREESQCRYIDASGYNALSRQIIQYLEAHFAENVSLENLAEALGKNKSYLCIAFKKDTQVTINDCLNIIRIRRAAELITYSDYSLTQVSSLCGFSSASHFNRVFLKHAGITPGQCRKAYPDNILIPPEQLIKSDAIRASDRFMYSVLAQKRIPLNIQWDTPTPE